MTKTILVTGSAVGIGRGFCTDFAVEGATVIGLDIDATENTETGNLVTRAGGKFLPFTCDIGDRAAVAEVFDTLKNEISSIDLLVNNAAVFADTSLKAGSFTEQTKGFESGMGACALGAYYCTAGALPYLKQAAPANIINILTDHVKPGHELTGGPATAYDCAKFALLRLTENWAVELKADSIRVNGLCFGATNTPMLRKFAPHMVDQGMKVEDVTLAARNVINQGKNGATGESYEFGMGPTPRATSLQEIEKIAQG